MDVLVRGLCGMAVLLGAVSLGACHTSSKPKAEAGSVHVNSAKMTATVQSIDYTNRMITLQMPNGHTKTYKVSKDVVNFDQIKPHDRITLTTAESVAVSIRTPGSPAPMDAQTTTVTLAPKGAKPGMVATDTTTVSAQIVSIDPWTRHVTLKTPTGGQQTVKAASGIDLSKFKKGDEVIIRKTEDLAITVETP